MNWTCLVYGGPMTGALIWWVVSARKWFKGPKVNIEHHMHGRVPDVIDGKEESAESGGSSTNSVTKETFAFDEKRVANLA